MATVLGVVAILILFIAVPLVLVVSFTAARARRQLLEEERGETPPPD